ncbi:MAG: hypothetical protein GOV01_03875 [Candidatus Altiarchaeota archaeon]|nr:hypothetical protein [Candidatus Altiarchaeota archaeon]
MASAIREKWYGFYNAYEKSVLFDRGRTIGILVEGDVKYFRTADSEKPTVSEEQQDTDIKANVARGVLYLEQLNGDKKYVLVMSDKVPKKTISKEVLESYGSSRNLGKMECISGISGTCDFHLLTESGKDGKFDYVMSITEI